MSLCYLYGSISVKKTSLDLDNQPTYSHGIYINLNLKLSHTSKNVKCVILIF